MVGIRQGSQLHEPDPIWILFRDFRRDLEGEPCLSGAADAGQREHIRRGQEPHHLSYLPLAPHEARQLAGEVVDEGIQGFERREVGGKIRVRDLKELLRLLQTLEPV